MKFFALFIYRPVATILISLAITLCGILGFRLLPVAPLPQVDFPVIMVSASLPGASPETMASSVATPLERSLGRIAGVNEMTSSSSLGSTRIILEFNFDRDINGAARDVQAAINAAQSLLPSGMPSRPTYRKANPSDAPIMILTLTSDTYSQGELYDFASTQLAQTIAQIDGVGEAFDEIEAMERAREQCRVVQSVVPVREGKNLLSMDITKPKAKQKNLAVMCAQFATILNAGVPAARATSLVADQVTDKYLKRVLADVAADVASGHSLAESFQSKGENLPRVFIETVRAGEESGHLPESFQRLHGYFDKRAKVSAKVQSAVTYPIFVAVIAVVVLAIMMVMVIPSMTGMIASLGADTPAMTQFLIDASNFVTDNFLLIAVVLALIVVGVKLFGTTERGKTTFAVLKLRLPVLGAVGVCSGAAQFANTMAMLVTAGLPATRAVAITSRVMSNYVLSREVGRLEAGLEEGRTLGEGLEASTYLPRTLVEMVTVGEHTGELEETLETMGAFYDDETQRVTNKAISIMEPALLVLMALFAGFIVIALYLPMFSLYAAM